MKVLSVNVARIDHRLIGGRRVATAIGKRAASGMVGVLPLGLEGDEQADPSVHGGISKAVYAYGLQHYAFWQGVRAQARAGLPEALLPPGFMGENLSIDGLDEAQCFVGDRWRLPGCVLAISEPRMPCFKFNAVMGFSQAGRLMAQSGWCGSYLAVIEPGVVQAGDDIEVIPGPREVSIRELFIARMKKQAL